MPAKKRHRLSALESDMSSYPDLFGLLPDCILIQILSLRSSPSKKPPEPASSPPDGATSGLSSPSASSTTTASSTSEPPVGAPTPRALTDDEARCARSITQILSSHPGPIHSCRLVRRFSDLPAVHGWIQALTQRDIQQFFVSSFGAPEPYLLPPSFFLCESLRKLNLGNCRLPWFPPPSPTFPNLRDLILRFSFLTDGAITNLLSD